MRRAFVILCLVSTSARAEVDKLQAARASFAAGDFAAAEAAVGGAHAATDEAKVFLAEIYRATGRYAEARTALEAIVKKNPKNLRARADLGLVYEDTGEKDL